MNTKTEKPKFFWRKNLFKNSQNRKTENPNPPPPPSSSVNDVNWLLQRVSRLTFQALADSPLKMLFSTLYSSSSSSNYMHNEVWSQMEVLLCSIELLFYLSLNIVIIVLLTFRKFECTHGSPQELETCLTSITTMDSRFPTVQLRAAKVAVVQSWVTFQSLTRGLN